MSVPPEALLIFHFYNDGKRGEVSTKNSTTIMDNKLTGGGNGSLRVKVITLITAVTLSGAAALVPFAAIADHTTAHTIETLTAQINALQAQLGKLSTSSTTSSASKCSFVGDLTMGARGTAVTCLQNYLKSAGHYTYSGGSTGYFGGVTKAAVIAWQKANGVSPAVGYFGAKSRAKYDMVVAGTPTPTPTPTPPGTPTPPPTPVPAGSGLTVVAGDDQPKSQLAPNSATRLAFTKATFTASADGDVTVRGVTVERKGQGADAALSEILLLDESLTQLGVAKTLNSLHQATLTEPFVVKAGTSRMMTIGATRPASDSTSVAGQEIRLAIVSVDAGTSKVNATFPIQGNTMTMNATLTIGSVTNQTGSFKTVATTTEAIGKTAFVFTSIRVSAGAAEKIRVKSIRWNQVGSVGPSDIANVKTTAGDKDYEAVISSDGKYYTSKFGDGIVLDTGASVEIYVKGDIVGGANRTIKFDLYRATDLAVSGETFGYGIVPPTSGTGFAASNPWYFASQVTVGKGSVNVENATSVISQNIPINVAAQPFGGITVEIKGEPVSVGKTVFNLATSGKAGSTVTSVALYDANGKVVAGPVDASGAATAPPKVTFTDTITYPVGKNTYTLKGKLSTDFASNDTIKASTTPSSDWTTVTGITTGETVSPTPSSAVSLNTMTVKAAALTISVSTDPPAQTVVSGASAFTFAKYQLDAGASGEDVKMSSIPLEYNAAANVTNLTSCQLYDGATSITTGNNVVNPGSAGSSTVFTFDGSGLIIAKGTVKLLALKCNVASGGTGSYSWGYDSSSSPTATGQTSSQTITIVENDSAGQQMTLTANGTMAVALDSASPAYAITAAGTTNNTAAVLRFTSTNEAIKLNTVALQLSQSASNSPSDLVKVTLWDGATKVGETTFTSSNDLATSTLDTEVIIPKDGAKILTVKVDLTDQGVSSAGIPGAWVVVDWDGGAAIGTRGVGISSGVNIDAGSVGGADTAANGLRVYKAYPTYADVSLSDTKLVAGRRDLKKFKITAVGPAGAQIGIEKITFRVATSSVTAQVDMIDNVNVYAFTDSNFSNAVSGVQTDGALSDANLDLSFTSTAKYNTPWVSSATDLSIYAMTSAAASTTLAIPAGETRYFAIRGDSTTAGATYSASTQVQGDAAYVGVVGTTALGSVGYSNLATTTVIDAFNAATTQNNFIWRPFSTTTTQSQTANDYSTGYGIPGLPTTNTAAQILTQ